MTFNYEHTHINSNVGLSTGRHTIPMRKPNYAVLDILYNQSCLKPDLILFDNCNTTGSK